MKGRVVCATLALVVAVACAHLGKIDQALVELSEQAVGMTEQLHAASTITDAQVRAISVVEHDVAVALVAFNKLAVAGTAKPIDGADLLRAVRVAVGKLKTIAPAALVAVLNKYTEFDQMLAKWMGDVAATVPAGGV